MNPYPGDNSVIIMDNARIHYDSDLILLVFLPPYSPDYNPIETAFLVIKL